MVQILVFGCAYERIADGSCSESTLRRRRDEWIELGVMERLREISLDAYDRLIGLELADLAVDGCITKAPCGGEKAGRSPVDRGKGGIKRSAVVDAKGIPLGTITAPANTHDSPLLEATLDALEPLGELPDRARVHMDCAYDSATTHRELAARWSVRSPRTASLPRSRPGCGGLLNEPIPGATPTRSLCGVRRGAGGSCYRQLQPLGDALGEQGAQGQFRRFCTF